jgi:formate dehydrogenase
LAEKVKGNWATLNPRDAERLGVADGDRVRLISGTGAVDIEVRLSDDIREGVVAVHQFWGHHYDSGMRTSRKYPGVNVNLLHDDRVRDAFCGMPVFNGTPCRIERLAGNETPAGEKR